MPSKPRSAASPQPPDKPCARQNRPSAASIDTSVDGALRLRPLIEAMHDWLTAQLPRISKGSDLAKAMRYTLRHWVGLTLFLDDGRIELDTNTVEREIRRIPLGRKNALFAGNDTGAEHWALIATLIASAKLNDVEPLAYLPDILERIVSGRTKATEIGRLLPWKWKAERAATEIEAAA